MVVVFLEGFCYASLMVYLLENPEGDDERTLARMLLAYGLKQEYGISGELAVKTAPMGKPYLSGYPQIYFNYSHCRRGILCGISNGEIGVDIETIIPYKERLAARICHSEELRMIQETDDKEGMLTAVWTAKEAYLKYLGTGIRSDLRKINLSAAIKNHACAGKFYLHSIIREEYGMCVCCTEPSIAVRKICIKKDAVEGAVLIPAGKEQGDEPVRPLRSGCV